MGKTMEFLVRRVQMDTTTTLGELFIDGAKFCDTLEDVVRPQGVKVKGQTAIPAGRYRLVIDFSPKFRRMMPHVLNVPMFDGIRWHCGNWAKDTEGCLLVGKKNSADMIIDSRLTFNALFPILQKAQEEKVEMWVTYKNAPTIVPLAA